MMNLTRLKIFINGQVQGVGFRPHAYRIARRLGLSGWVCNSPSGVLIEVQGHAVSDFLPELMTDLPPLAKIAKVLTTAIPPEINEQAFQIADSVNHTDKHQEKEPFRAIISPDITICPACLNELFDQANRYSHYPFLNCTHCGPRFTITRRLPYDRCQTSMAEFPLCKQCQYDYADPDNRRYHAQPTACANCGPRLSESVAEIAKYILDGDIVAIKGLGGYHLICDARNHHTVSRLRARKSRDAKPFALMVANVESARRFSQINQHAEKILTSKERPIVLLPKQDEALIGDVAPGLSHYGVMLPYTPLHYLLFHALSGNPKHGHWINESNAAILVVTSANPGSQPLIIDDSEQSELRRLADRVVSYNRDIVCRVDDSLVHIIDDAPLFIRRSRGFAPATIKLPHTIPSTLALGGHLKNTFCVTRDDEAFVSQHIGSMSNKATIDFFHESLDHFLEFLDVKPERIAHDLHPDFYTSRFAQGYGIPAFAIQHHHAHLAAVLAEHHTQGPALGLALDGYGYGTDKEAWGGELLYLDGVNFERLGSLYPLPQPGGEKASLEPWRMGASVMHVLGRGHEIPARFRAYPHSELLPQLLSQRLNTPRTSSCGRLFDAASSLLGINSLSQYEGQAAMQLESLVTNPRVLPGGWQIERGCLSLLPTLSHLIDADPVEGANVFHGTLIAGLVEWVLMAAEQLSVNVILLGGGCFLNKVLSEGLIRLLSSKGLKPIISRQVPPNDGGLSLGQAWIAGRMTLMNEGAIASQ
jgi:hydrogenase maturation protein HypF